MFEFLCWTMEQGGQFVYPALPVSQPYRLCQFWIFLKPKIRWSNAKKDPTPNKPKCVGRKKIRLLGSRPKPMHKPSASTRTSGLRPQIDEPMGPGSIRAGAPLFTWDQGPYLRDLYSLTIVYIFEQCGIDVIFYLLNRVYFGRQFVIYLLMDFVIFQWFKDLI